MGLAGRKRSGGGGRGGGGGGRERRRFRRHSSHASPPSFFPASGYLLIGYSKISETRRYRRRKRGDAREDENRRKRERGREVEKAEGYRKRGHRWEGCRGPYARVGVNYHYPQRRGFLFVPASSFLFLSPLPDPTPPTPSTHPPTHHQRASIPPLAFATRSPSHPPALPSPPLPLRTTVHLKYEFDITFHPTALARPPPRTSSSVSSLPAPIPPPVIAVRPLPVPAQFNCWHFIKSIDSAPSCLRLCKLMPRPTGRELFLASAFVGIGM